MSEKFNDLDATADAVAEENEVLENLANQTFIVWFTVGWFKSDLREEQGQTFYSEAEAVAYGEKMLHSVGDTGHVYDYTLEIE